MLPQGFNYFTDTPVDFSTGYQAPTAEFEDFLFRTIPNTFETEGPVDKSDMQSLLDFLERERDPERLRQKLQMNLDFEKERMAQAAPYKLAFDIPRQLGEAFFKPALMELAGAGKYAQIMDAGIARMPNMVPGAVQLSPNVPRQYFK